MNPHEQAIAILEQLLLDDLRPSVRVAAIQNLARIGCHYPINLQLLYDAATKDPNPRVCIAAIVAITDLALPTFFTSTMSDSPKVQMTFNAPVYGATGNIEGNQI